MSEVTLITSMFNINRAEWSGFERSSEKYLNYFSYWARMKNKVVVYVDSKGMADAVLNIRKQYGLEEKTIIQIVDDYTKIDEELYLSIKKATENQIQIQSRLRPNNPESWNANYNYIMMLKTWCVVDSVKKGFTSADVAWIDFGFGHGDSNFVDASDFDFMWETDFNNKIYLFYIQPLDDRPIFDIIKSMDTYLMGPIIFGKAHLWENFYQLMRKSMMALNVSGLVDDDQVIMLMAYRSNPELFEMNPSIWFKPLETYSGHTIHFKVGGSENKSKVRALLRKTPLRIAYRKIERKKEINRMQRTEYKRYSSMKIH